MGLTARTDTRSPYAGARRYLFVCGVPRSGTTALALLLNRHPSIGIGIERYRFFAVGDDARLYSEELFQTDRFFSYRPEDGAADVFDKYQHVYADLAGKWEHCLLVGDKVPRLYAAAERVWQKLPGAVFVFIARDVLPVALSWQRRADDSEDASWPTSNDFQAGVAEWNRGVAKALELAKRYPRKFYVVSYQALAAGGPAALDPLFTALKVPSLLDAGVVADKVFGESIDAEASEEQLAYVRSHADNRAYQELLRRSIHECTDRLYRLGSG